MTDPVTNFDKLIANYILQIQDLERVAFQLVNERSVSSAQGSQLDGLGSIVGEDRLGRNDDDYRSAVRGRIRLNLSNGTVEDLLAVLQLQVGDRQLVLTESFPAHFDLLVVEAIAIVPASVTSANAGPYGLTTGQYLLIVVDGGSPQAVVFDAADFVDISNATTHEVAAVIDRELSGGNAIVSYDRIVIRSNSLGDDSAIKINGGTANPILGFDLVIHTGPEANQALMKIVSTLIQKARSAGVRGILLWNTCSESFGFDGTIGALGFGEGCFASALD